MVAEPLVCKSADKQIEPVKQQDEDKTADPVDHKRATRKQKHENMSAPGDEAEVEKSADPVCQGADRCDGEHEGEDHQSFTHHSPKFARLLVIGAAV